MEKSELRGLILTLNAVDVGARARATNKQLILNEIVSVLVEKRVSVR